jgi:hypothetical protein
MSDIAKQKRGIPFVKLNMPDEKRDSRSTDVEKSCCPVGNKSMEQSNKFRVSQCVR